MLRNMRKQFGEVIAVDHVDLNIAGGNLFFLLGPSGCGKTTLMRMMGGFCDPTGCTIIFGDRDVTNIPANKRQLWYGILNTMRFGLT